MRHITTIFLAAVFVLSMVNAAHGATTQNKEMSLKKPLVKEDLTKSTKAVKKVKSKKISKKAVAPKRVVLDMDKKSNKKAIKGKAIAKKSQNKKYWSVECKQGFIKDSYVYCARTTASNRSPASVHSAKKSQHKKMAMKKAKQTVRK